MKLIYMKYVLDKYDSEIMHEIQVNYFILFLFSFEVFLITLFSYYIGFRISKLK